jgi:hypothetical protein
MHIPLHALSDWSAVSHFVAPLPDMHVPLHALSDWSVISHSGAPLTDISVPLHPLSDWSAIFHFVALLIGIHAIYVSLLLTYAFSHSHEVLTLPLLLS